VNSVLRDSVRSVIHAVATNQDITKYFDISVEVEKQDLVTTLSQLRPYPAQFCAELFRCSEPGLAMQVIALFDNTRTLVQLAQTSNQGNLIQKIREEERKFTDYLQELAANPRFGNKLARLIRDVSCPTQMALDLPFECFKTEIHGATVDCPVDQVEFQYLDKSSNDDFQKSILVTVSKDLTDGMEVRELTLGPFRSYIGSKVVEKVVKSPVGDIPKTRTNDAARRLATLLSWSKRACSENVTRIVYQLMNDNPKSHRCHHMFW